MLRFVGSATATWTWLSSRNRTGTTWCPIAKPSWSRRVACGSTATCARSTNSSPYCSASASATSRGCRPALVDEDLAEALVQDRLELERLVDLVLRRVAGAHEQLAEAHGRAGLGDGSGFHAASIGRKRPGMRAEIADDGLARRAANAARCRARARGANGSSGDRVPGEAPGGDGATAAQREADERGRRVTTLPAFAPRISASRAPAEQHRVEGAEQPRRRQLRRRARAFARSTSPSSRSVSSAAIAVEPGARVAKRQARPTVRGRDRRPGRARRGSGGRALQARGRGRPAPARRASPARARTRAACRRSGHGRSGRATPRERARTRAPARPSARGQRRSARATGRRVSGSFVGERALDRRDPTLGGRRRDALLLESPRDARWRGAASSTRAATGSPRPRRGAGCRGSTR